MQDRLREHAAEQRLHDGWAWVGALDQQLSKAKRRATKIRRMLLQKDFFHKANKPNKKRHVPGTPSVLFLKATLPLKPATIVLKMGYLAFQVVWLKFFF